ncbi:MAG: cytochrome c [Acidobacteria bacterium]|nr:cytochrome c [Acidobacteriota bacterium]
MVKRARHVRPWVIGGVLLAASASPAAAQDTAVYFKQNCASCHTIGGGRLVGPDLKDVATRRDRAWLVEFILAPSDVIARADPYALQLQQEARGVVMPTLTTLDRILVGRILDLIGAESVLPKSQFAGIQISERPFTGQDINLGRALFRGDRRLSGGGPSCISCHTIRGIGGLGGGQLGPDLTRVYERLLGRKALATWLNAPPTPTMRGVFAQAGIADGEVFALVAHFEHAARQGGQDNRGGLLEFLLLGVGGAVVGLIALTSAWRNRFTNVRRTLVGRRRLTRS